ncbi:MAG: hypothetical protein GKR89_37575 [Candidatus Latescibacteria bacterium]|nr:hypothetical protein [Candidatus Latescibacterota bacterium]
MYTLENDALKVSVLDPVADQERFGTRYCTGGYIFQVEDSRSGPLLSGPTYPDSFNTFDGQGIPDAFNLSPLRDRDQPDQALIIGIGQCDLAANQVDQFCTWSIAHGPDVLTMRTEQAHGPFALDLERSIALYGRTLRSSTRLTNKGRRPISIRWFPHPFFPQPDGDELCRLNIPVAFPPNLGYRLDVSGFIARKSWPWTQGHYQALDHQADANLVLLQKHPQLGLMGATCSYVPSFFPIWGNPQTFSWEPFLERTIASGQNLSWWIAYDF